MVVSELPAPAGRMPTRSGLSLVVDECEADERVVEPRLVSAVLRYMWQSADIEEFRKLWPRLIQFGATHLKLIPQF